MGAGKVCLLIRYHTLQCNVLIYITIYLILNGRCEMGHTAYSTAFIIRNSNLKQEKRSDGFIISNSCYVSQCSGTGLMLLECLNTYI